MKLRNLFLVLALATLLPGHASAQGLQGPTPEGAPVAGNPAQMAGKDTNGNVRRIKLDTTGAAYIANWPSTWALGAGSAAIGTVGVTSLPALPSGSNTIGAVTISGTPTFAGTGNFTVAQSTGSNLHVQVDSTVLPTGAATNAVLTGGTQETQLVGSTGNVATIDGNGSQQVRPGFNETTGLTSSANNTVLADVDVSGYKSFSLALTGTSVQTITCYASSDNTNLVNIPLNKSTDTTSAPQNSVTMGGSSNLLVYGEIHTYHWLIIKTTAYTSGTASGILDLSTQPDSLNVGGVAATQSGTLTVQPGNTANTTPWLTTPSAGTGVGATPFTYKNLAGTVQALKSSAGTLYSLHIANTQTAGTWAYVDIWNTASGSVTIGTTVPVCEVPVNGGQTVTVNVPEVGDSYATAISLASVTASQGGTGSSSGVIVSGSYK